MMRAKMRVAEVIQRESSETLKMVVVGKKTTYGPSGEDEDNTFALWTPSGNLELCVTNPALFGKFKPGQKFYLDFTLVPEEN